MTRDWLVLPSLWVLLEWLRGWAFSGFPWLSLGYAFIDSPLAGWAPVLGVYGVTCAAALAATGLGVLSAPGVLAARQSTAAQAAAARAAALVAIAALLLAPGLAGRHEWTPQG